MGLHEVRGGGWGWGLKHEVLLGVGKQRTKNHDHMVAAMLNKETEPHEFWIKIHD